MGSMVSGPAAGARPRDDLCALCRKPRSRSGEHRGVALPCGHGFGHSCLSRRLRTGPARCPQCGARGSLSQLRPAPGRGSGSSSGSQEGDREPEEPRSREREELRRERAERRRLETELVETRQRLMKRENVVRMLQAELRKLQRKVRLEESDGDYDSNVSWTPRGDRGDLSE